jgi:hypothetical protein
MAVVRYAERNGTKRPWLVQLTSNATLNMPLANGGPSTQGALADRRLSTP